MLLGIVGKPNAGKSTFFKAATLADAAIASFPFTTIKPNRAVGFVRAACPEGDFGTRCMPRAGSCQNGIRFVPVELLDVAGLVPDAHRGAGMGLQFLSDLNMADALVHIVDASGGTDEGGKIVEPGSHDPVRDIAFLERELDQWYFQTIRKGWESFAKKAESLREAPEKALAKQLSGMGVTDAKAKEAVRICRLDRKLLHAWTPEDLLELAHFLRESSKPMLIAANKADVPGAAENVERINDHYPDRIVVACSGDAELALKEAAHHGLVDYLPGDPEFTVKEPDRLLPKQQQALTFLRKHVLQAYGSTGVQQALQEAVFTLLNYKAIFPVPNASLKDKDGRVLPDCFLVPKQTTALEFAHKVHTELGQHFIRAVDVRKKLPIGKDHVLEDGAVIEIVAGK